MVDGGNYICLTGKTKILMNKVPIPIAIRFRVLPVSLLCNLTRPIMVNQKLIRVLDFWIQSAVKLFIHIFYEDLTAITFSSLGKQKTWRTKYQYILFFSFVTQGDFDPYVSTMTFWQNVDFLISNAPCVSTHDSTVYVSETLCSPKSF